ncbi:DUF6677 family protein [Salinicoccus carnicancri]|uniref:DUF6677 family protein n=1 Tax=Salinicoccus carnicancri TaxID=558170 RepID=UPI000369EC75|nr:DUF6677 family protein [Salinicoccus carnicancri]
MKKKWVAVVLSFLFPGLGHIYLGRFPIGITLIVLTVGSWVLGQVVNPVIGLIYFVLWIFAMIHSAKITREINAQMQR